MKIHSCLKPLIVASCLFACALPPAHGGSATWNLNPGTGTWNTAGNWTPATVPNGPSDVATFGVSNLTDLTIKSAVEVSAIDFTAGASAFTISALPRVTLTISGTGVSNDSGIGQNFAASDNSSGAGAIVFMGSATAGDGNTYTNNAHSTGLAASTQFFGTSNAGTSTIINTNPGQSFHTAGFTGFFDQSSAANSTIINEVPRRGDVLDAFPSITLFADNSTAGNAILIAQGSPHASGDTWSEIDFYDQSTADHATITLEGGGPVLGGVAGTIFFDGTATAGNASITMEGAPPGANEAAFGHFLGSSTAGNATILLENGGGVGASLSFFSTTSGGEAAFTVNGNAVLDMQFHSQPGMSVGSLAGDGIVHIGPLSLTVGTNNLDTQFAGTIDDGTNSTGSLVKTGTGSLTLSGANTYGGGTTVTSGTLLVTNKTGSAIGTGAVQVNSGTFGGDGTISGAATIGTGSGTGAFLAPGATTGEQATIHLAGALTFKSDGTYSWTINSRRQEVRFDEVVAHGVTIETGATFTVGADVRGSLSLGTVLTVISNTAATPIAGTFANLADGITLAIGSNHLRVSYEGGNGNDLTFTVIP
jgi:autotransporter-associated beta strand protein